MLNVAIDVSPLGDSLRFKYARSGVFRMVDELTKGLIASNSCKLSYTAISSLETLEATEEFFRSHSLLKNVSIIEPFQSRWLSRPLRRQCIQPKLWENLSPVEKLFQRIVWRAYNLSLEYTPQISEAQFNEIQIFHSTFTPLPAASLFPRKLKRFLTIYDVIAIKHPQFFGGSDLLLQNIVGSLTPEDWVVSISQATKQDLLELRPDLHPEKVLVTPLAAADHFYPCSNSSIESIKKKYSLPNSPYILSLCTLEPRKNLATLIRSFFSLVTQECIGDLNLVLAGSKGWDFDSIFDAIATEPALKNRVIVTGYIDDVDLAALCSGALMFVYPSLMEGFGLPPLEAMQCGTPVITSNTSSLPEVVADAGLMFDPTNADALSESMLLIYSDSELRNCLKAKSLERAKQFSWGKFTQETLRAYSMAVD